MSTTHLKSRVWAEIDNLQAEAVDIAKDIHAHPELGWDTPRSAGLLMDYMEKHGMNVERGIADIPVAFRSSIKGRDDSGTGVALLAEYDALPELGHACSHNLIGTIAATAGIALSRVLGPEIAGNVYVMGCPYEEGGAGKVYLLDRGVFDPADISIMWHGANKVRVGNPNIASGRFTLTFHGKPAHSGQAPHLGVNAADAAMLTFAGINALRQHVTPDCRISGFIKHGGAAANVTPDLAVAVMQTRAMHLEDVLALRERVYNCARGAALMTGCTLEIEEVPVYANRLIVESLREVVMDNMPELGVTPPTDDAQSFASADSGNVSQKIPHVTFSLPVDNKGSVPHTAAFAEACNSEMGYEAMITAAKIMAATAIDLLSDPERVEKIKAEHAAIKAARAAEVAAAAA